MRVMHHIKSLREIISERKALGQRIGFVPTMGNLHDAHLALVKIARMHCDCVVSSIFVNRLQFGLNEDWDKYPRTLEADKAKLISVNCDLLFCPDETDIYPNGMDTQTRVIVPTMANILCGASRPRHFEGVTTVVSKLFNIVQPDVAVFGLKDYQQLAIIKRMTQDLCIPVTIIEGDIVREGDGLAMSSRNGFITSAERPHVTALIQALHWVADQIKAGSRDFVRLQEAAKQHIVKAGFRPDYMTVCHAKTLALAAHDDVDLRVLGAMYTAGARLIDNVSVSLS